MIVYSSKLEKECGGKLEGIYDIEGYAGRPIIPYHKVLFNLNENHTYRLDFKDRVMFWDKGEITDLPIEFR